MPFFIIFLLIPLVEIAVFIQVGQHIGIVRTMLFAFLTAIIGGAIIRHQGLQAFTSAQESLRQNAMPMRELFDGFCLVAAGALLITPGFVTDTIGFLLLVPMVRDGMRGLLSRYSKFEGPHGFSEQNNPHHPPPPPGVIEGEYERLDDENPKH